MNVKNYMALGSLFFRIFFHPIMYFIHTSTRACLFAESGGVLYENEDRSATHKDGRCIRPPFPHPTHIALRMSRHPVIKPQSTMVQTNDIVQM